jgi:ribonuclease Z
MTARRRRALAALALGLMAAVLGFYAFRGPIAVMLMRRVAMGSILRDTIATLPDGLHVGFCGTGSPFPSLTRSGPCTAIVAGRRLFLVDAGRGTADLTARMGLRSEHLQTVLLTHFHSDHIDGLGQLGELHWLAGRAQAPLVVMGPTGVERVGGGFNEAHALNGTYRTAHHGAEHAPPAGFGSRRDPSPSVTANPRSSSRTRTSASPRSP